MRWLVKDAQPDDSLFFHCQRDCFLNNFNSNFASDSGHGGQTEDKDGDEVDGYDEGIWFFLLSFRCS